MIKLAKPYIPDNAIEEVIKVLKSGNLVQGQIVHEFEEKLKEYLDVEYAILVSSCTAALHISLIALNIKHDDEVIVPAFTFPATANVVELVGAKPVFVDITLDDYCIDTTKIENVITKKTKAIIPVHEFGQAAKIDDILKIAYKHKLKIIEDAACALGTEFENKKVGTIGNVGCFSFHPRKAITTGEGGAVVTNNKNIADKIRSLRNHGIEVRNSKTDFIYAGMNYRLTEFQAALGLAQFVKFEKILIERIRLAQIYDEELNNFDLVKIPSRFNNRKMVYQTYHILLDKNCKRDRIIKELKNMGVETNIGAQALNELYYYKTKYKSNPRYDKNSVIAYKQGLALPLWYGLTEDDVKIVVKKLLKAIN